MKEPKLSEKEKGWIMLVIINIILLYLYLNS
jgi:hypothetical protein